MKRRQFTIIVAGTAAVWPLAAPAQPPRPVALIGALWSGGNASDPMLVATREGFLRGLREDGYLEGRNFTIESRYGSSAQEFRKAAEELVQLAPDVIIAGGSTATVAVKRATDTIPIVGMVLADPVADGLVQTLARPAGNLTGNTFIAPELGPKRFELLREIVPAATRFAVLQHPGIFNASTMQSILGDLERKASETGLTLHVFTAGRLDDFGLAFEAMAKAQVQGVIVLPSPLFYVNNRRLVEAAMAQRLPTIFAYREAVEAGGLVGYGADIPDLFRRGGKYVVRILRGAKPSDLPVEQPTKFELVINVKAAKALGLTIPQSLLFRADEVIE